MRICQPHWDMLRAEVDAAGLSAWVSHSGEVAAQQLIDQAEQGPTPVNYDPLMDCHNMIMDRALHSLGLAIFNPDFGCPLCFINNDLRSEDSRCLCGHPDCPNQEPGSMPEKVADRWIVGPDSCVAAAKSYMEQQGWITEERHDQG